GELPQRLIVERRIARSLQDDITRDAPTNDGGIRQHVRLEHLVGRPGLQRERRGGELGQRGRRESGRRIELLDDTVVVIEVYGGGRYERSALLERVQRAPLCVRRKRGGGEEDQREDPGAGRQ